MPARRIASSGQPSQSSSDGHGCLVRTRLRNDVHSLLQLRPKISKPTVPAPPRPATPRQRQPKRDPSQPASLHAEPRKARGSPKEACWTRNAASGQEVEVADKHRSRERQDEQSHSLKGKKDNGKKGGRGKREQQCTDLLRKIAPKTLALSSVRQFTKLDKLQAGSVAGADTEAADVQLLSNNSLNCQDWCNCKHGKSTQPLSPPLASPEHCFWKLANKGRITAIAVVVAWLERTLLHLARFLGGGPRRVGLEGFLGFCVGGNSSSPVFCVSLLGFCPRDSTPFCFFCFLAPFVLCSDLGRSSRKSLFRFQISSIAFP